MSSALTQPGEPTGKRVLARAAISRAVLASPRMNAACERALSVGTIGGPHRRSIEVILKRGLDQQPAGTTATRTTPLQHENVRGGDYYDRKETVH